MWKEKVTYLFNKNNITLEKIEKCKSLHMDERSARRENAITGRNNARKEATKTIIKKVTKESPLGFYYTKEVKETINVPTDKNSVEKHWYIITANMGNDVYYRLKFLIECGENKVYPQEDSLRPWEVAEGDNMLNGTMLDALVKTLNEFFDMLSRYKIVFKYLQYKDTIHEWVWVPANDQIESVKDDVYSYMYGNKNGLRVMTDEQKIISHGFDLKTSFRKDKEAK